MKVFLRRIMSGCGYGAVAYLVLLALGVQATRPTPMNIVSVHAPLCGIFHPNSVAVAHYGALIRAKYPTNCDAHLAESLFQTHSSIRSIIFSTRLPPALSYHPVHDNRCIPAPVPVFPCRNLSVIPREHP